MASRQWTLKLICFSGILSMARLWHLPWGGQTKICNQNSIARANWTRPLKCILQRAIGRLQRHQGFLWSRRKVVNHRHRPGRKTWVGVNHLEVHREEGRAAKVEEQGKVKLHHSAVVRDPSQFLTLSTSTRNSIWTNSRKSCKDHNHRTVRSAHLGNQRGVADLQTRLGSNITPQSRAEMSRLRYSCRNRPLICLIRYHLTSLEVHCLAATWYSRTDSLHVRRKSKNKWIRTSSHGTTWIDRDQDKNYLILSSKMIITAQDLHSLVITQLIWIEPTLRPQRLFDHQAEIAQITLVQGRPS